MDLRQLSMLLAVADHGSFSRAADAMHTVQSNVSTHLARLEAELGVVLVDRSNGRLTPEGEVVADRARRIRSELDALVSDIASLHADITGTVRLGVIGTTARWLIPPLLDELQRRHPRVQLVVTDATTSSLQLMLGSGRLDLAVINFPLSDPDIDTELLFDEDRRLVAPPGHPLHHRASVTVSDLAHIPLLLEPRGTAFRDELDHECAVVGVKLEAQAEVDGMRLLATLAFDGFGAAILPASAAPTQLEGAWRRIPIEGLQGRAVGLATRRRSMLSAPAQAVQQAIRDVVATRAADQDGVHPRVTTTG